jgi:membrane-bound serine protease (ClpP class)
MAIQAFGGEVEVNTGGAVIQERDMTFLDRILNFLANPNIAFIFIALGSIALFIELLHPGIWIPGTIGVALLVLGFVGVGNLDFSWAGVAFLALALVLFILEAQAPGVSYFGGAGVVSLVLGGIFLVGRFTAPDLSGAAQTVSIWLLIVVGGSALAFVIWLLWQIRLSRRSPLYVSPGASSQLVGQVAEVTYALEPVGEVFIAGEKWSARHEDDEEVPVGRHVRVVRVEGVSLVVEPVSEDAAGSGEQPLASGV